MVLVKPFVNQLNQIALNASTQTHVHSLRRTKARQQQSQNRIHQAERRKLKVAKATDFQFLLTHLYPI